MCVMFFYACLFSSIWVSFFVFVFYYYINDIHKIFDPSFLLLLCSCTMASNIMLLSFYFSSLSYAVVSNCTVCIVNKIFAPYGDKGLMHLSL